MKPRLSLPGNPHPGITFHAGGNFDFQNLFFMQDTLAAAFFAFVFNYPTAAFAIRAGLFNNKKAALAHLHFAMAVASRAYRLPYRNRGSLRKQPTTEWKSLFRRR